MFGLNPQDGVPTTEAFWQRIHPEDLDRTREVLLKAAAGNMEYDHGHRIVLPDGTVKHIHAIGHPVLDQDGQVAEYVGTTVDVTERRLAEARVRERTVELQASNQALRKSEEDTRRAFEEIQRLKAQLEQQNEYLREEVVEAKAFGDLVGQSAVLRQVVSQIDLVAPTDASVIILGETGTGKELVAHEIHRRSRRQDKPLVRVNCASIPKDLYESEFFGHVKGAFTGAVKDRAGRFETAEGGTLLLDEIAEVPLDLQSKLLRVLQEKRYERVGEDRTRQADVRIIAATNRDLKKEAEAGRFREDLFYRLNVFPIHVAPLRERKEDIPLLAQHFVQQSASELRCRMPRLTRAGIVRLQCYDWPGNVRELQNVIERAVILARGGVLEFDLPIRGAPPAKPPEARPADDDAAPEFLTEAQLRQRERENLLAVLEKTRWKIRGTGGAAELLGVKATTLLSRMKAMGLKRPE
jgi:transcriptional regulator with GAF, ATPase, and Fis domain